MKKNNIPQEVRDYMSELGAKGGKANPAGTEKRRIQARDAANARWAKWRKEQEEEATK